MLRAPGQLKLHVLFALSCALLLDTALAVAQVSLRQVHRFRQTGPDSVQAVGYQVVVSYGLIFVGGTPPATGRLIGPSTTLDLAVQGSSGGYAATRNYGSEAAMQRDFPSGKYVLTVGTSSMSFMLDLSATAASPRLTNWAALQEWDGGPTEIRWTPVNQVLPEAGFGLSFSNPAGEAIYYPFGQNTAIDSIGRTTELPAGRQARFNVTSSIENGLSIYGVSGAINTVAGEWTGRLAVVAHGSRSSNPGVFAVVPATVSSAVNGNTLSHVIESVLEFPVRRLPVPPKILTRPIDQTLRVGTPVSFFVSATGGDLTFQWHRNGSAIAGATGMGYGIASLQATDVGDYHATVTNAFGSTSTPPVKLAIAGETSLPPPPPPPSADGYFITATSGPPAITKQPMTQTVYAGETFRFAVGVSGAQPFSFQWYRNGEPAVGGNNTTYSVLPAVPQVAGRYKVTITNPRGSVTSDEVELIVLPPPRITNLSVRAPLGGAADELTIGFTVGRRVVPNISGSESVTMVVRAVGPSLQSFGVADALSDPQFALYSGETLVAENDNWTGQPNFAGLMARVGAFPLEAGSKDAALFRALGQGNHSVRLSGVDGSSGIVLGEIYDTNDDAHFYLMSARLTNVSALARVGTGAEALSAGFVIAGVGTRTVLVRGVGPGLAAAGVASGFLRDPRLTLYAQGGTVVSTNDDWSGTTVLRGAFASVGAFTLPDDSRDAALVAVLGPGSYTVEVGSADNSTGQALIEVYELP